MSTKVVSQTSSQNCVEDDCQSTASCRNQDLLHEYATGRNFIWESQSSTQILSVYYCCCIFDTTCVPIFLHRSAPWHFDKKYSKEEDTKQETNITKLLKEVNERLQLRNKFPPILYRRFLRLNHLLKSFSRPPPYNYASCWRLQHVEMCTLHHTTLSSPLPLQSTPRLDTKSVIELPCARTSSTSDCWIKVQNLHQGHQSCCKLSFNDIKNTTVMMIQSPSNASNRNWWEPVLQFCRG